MISLGGPMDTWMVKQFPWIVKEKNAIKEFVINLEKPFIGICLGCQLLGEVLGGRIQKSKFSELGFFNFIAKIDKIIFRVPFFKFLAWSVLIEARKN